MTAWQVYWIVTLDALLGLSCGILVIGILSTIGLTIAWCVCSAMGTTGEMELDALAAFRRKARPFVRLAVVLLITAGLVCTFLPTTKQAAAIIAIPRIYNAIAETSEIVGIPKQIGVLAGEWLEELRPVTDAVVDKTVSEVKP